MRKPLFTGTGVAIVTPFLKDAIDWDAFGRLIDLQLKSGTDAIVVCGTTGEATTLTYDERLRAIEFCVERINGRVPVIAGSGSNATSVAVTLSQDAVRAGADGLLVVTPYYNKASQEGLIRHYQTVADAVDRPVILYNVPSRTGVKMTPETYAELAGHPNIQGVKEASGDLGAIQKTRALCPEDFYIWSGNDDETVPIWVLGGVGVISVAANVIPLQMHRMTQLCREGDFRAAGAMQVEFKALCDALFCQVNPIPVKTAMELLGLCSGSLRLPLCPPDEACRGQIRRTLEQYGLFQAAQ